MARLSDFDELGRDYYQSMEMPEFETTPRVVPPKPLAQSRVAIISTAGLQRRGDRPFSVDSADYRLLPVPMPASDLIYRLLDAIRQLASSPFEDCQKLGRTLES